MPVIKTPHNTTGKHQDLRASMYWSGVGGKKICYIICKWRGGGGRFTVMKCHGGGGGRGSKNCKNCVT